MILATSALPYGVGRFAFHNCQGGLIRLLPDAHISGRVVGRVLEEAGHDMYALDSEKELAGMQDPDVLELAISKHGQANANDP